MPSLGGGNLPSLGGGKKENFMFDDIDIKDDDAADVIEEKQLKKVLKETKHDMLKQQ